jgi:hypothetical protein
MPHFCNNLHQEHSSQTDWKPKSLIAGKLISIPKFDWGYPHQKDMNLRSNNNNIIYDLKTINE